MTMSEEWNQDPPLIRDFVFLAVADSFRPTSIEQGRQILLRFGTFLRDRFSVRFEKAGRQEYAVYKAYLAEIELSRATIRCYLSYLTSFYRLRAQVSRDPKLLDVCTRVKTLGMVRKARGTRWKLLDLTMVPRLLQAALDEDYVFLMTLLYSGGRAQFYGLQVELEDVKREFAKLDLLAAVERQPKGQGEQSYLLGRLRDVASLGKEQAWQMIIEGLEGLLGEQAPSADATR